VEVPPPDFESGKPDESGAPAVGQHARQSALFRVRRECAALPSVATLCALPAKDAVPGVESQLCGGSWSARRLVRLNGIDAVVVADAVHFDLHLIPDLVAQQGLGDRGQVADDIFLRV
jgi:hypothetical protein